MVFTSRRAFVNLSLLIIAFSIGSWVYLLLLSHQPIVDDMIPLEGGIENLTDESINPFINQTMLSDIDPWFLDRNSTLYLDCSLPEVEDTAPVLVLTSHESIFYHSESETLVPPDWNASDYMKYAQEYYEETCADWSHPNVDISVVKVAPDYMSSSSEGSISHSIRVAYKLSTSNIPYSGVGADFSISLAGEKVVFTQINMITVDIVDTQTIISPIEALKRSLLGENVWNQIGIQPLCCTRLAGNVSITGVELVYYLSNDNQNYIPILYSIRGKIAVVEENGDVWTRDYINYVLATDDDVPYFT